MPYAAAGVPALPLYVLLDWTSLVAVVAMAESQPNGSLLDAMESRFDVDWIDTRLRSTMGRWLMESGYAVEMMEIEYLVLGCKELHSGSCGGR